MYKGRVKWYWAPITRNQIYWGNRHMFLHPQEWGPPRQQGRLQPHSMRHQIPEEKSPQSVTHSGRHQTNLRWPSIHPQSKFNHGQNPLEQRPLHPRRKISYCIFPELLPEKSNEEGWILQDSNKTHSPRDHIQALVVDDFGIKFLGDEHANHLKRSLEKYYKVTDIQGHC